MAKSAGVERWFASTKPPSEAALRRVRDIILGAEPSMRERIQYGITFSSTKIGDFAAFVRYSEPGGTSGSCVADASRAATRTSREGR